MGTGDFSLNPSIRSAETVEFQKALRAKIVGQDEGVQALVDFFQVFTAGMNSPGRPVANLLFLGPTGSGKTRIVEAAAEILFGNPRAVIKIDWLAPGVSGSPRDASAHHPGISGRFANRQAETVFSLV